MNEDSTRTSEIRPENLLFVSTTVLFAMLWPFVLWHVYRNWSTDAISELSFAILFPFPWIFTLRHRRNIPALFVSLFAYVLLSDAVKMMHM